MDDGGELCLEERVAQLQREGLSAEEIARVMGVDPGWVEALLSAWGED
ncbi:helix-turn-helix domain-containing protein [Rubrobacter xylanophilus]|nr:helix-turn-helix domain-containing protein [Rubrobacter xylanophilus]